MNNNTWSAARSKIIYKVWLYLKMYEKHSAHSACISLQCRILCQMPCQLMSNNMNDAFYIMISICIMSEWHFTLLNLEWHSVHLTNHISHLPFTDPSCLLMSSPIVITKLHCHYYQTYNIVWYILYCGILCIVGPVYYCASDA